MENLASDRREVVRSFASRLEAVEELLGWLEEVRCPGVPDSLWVQAQTALVEGFTNAVRHAHAPLDPPPPVAVRLLCCSSVLEIQVEDAGAPFQPGRAENPQPDRDSQWGLILLERLQEQHGWSIAYEPGEAGGNVLRIRHALDQDPSCGTPAC
jgi:serine/threonine-protein kinase RsbW